MKLILSPTKTMQTTPDGLPIKSLPKFLPQAESLIAFLRTRSPEQLRKIWKTNDAISSKARKQLASWQPDHGLTPAIAAFTGLQYRYLDVQTIDRSRFDYLQEHVRLFSGLYGLLRPFDGIAPYRLEMSARLAGFFDGELAEFWQPYVSPWLNETSLIIDLASAEYSRAFLPAKDTQVIKTRFLECRKNGDWFQQATHAKMARGRMVRFLSDQAAETPETIKMFHELGYVLSPSKDTETILFKKSASKSLPRV